MPTLGRFACSTVVLSLPHQALIEMREELVLILSEVVQSFIGCYYLLHFEFYFY